MTDSEHIRTLIQRYLAAYESHDAAGCAGAYAPNALVLSPWGPPLRGRQAILAAHTDWFAEGEHNKVMTIDDIEIDGDLAVCLLRYRADVPLGKVCGISLNTLQPQPDRDWKIRYTSLQELADEETGFQE